MYLWFLIILNTKYTQLYRSSYALLNFAKRLSILNSLNNSLHPPIITSKAQRISGQSPPQSRHGGGFLQRPTWRKSFRIASSPPIADAGLASRISDMYLYLESRFFVTELESKLKCHSLIVHSDVTYRMKMLHSPKKNVRNKISCWRSQSKHYT